MAETTNQNLSFTPDALGNSTGITDDATISRVSVDAPKFTTDDRVIKSLRYPTDVGRNTHYVRFYINVDEESSLVSGQKDSFEDRPVDFKNQNRTNNNTDNVTSSSKILAPILGGMIGASAAKHLFAGNPKVGKITAIGSLTGAASGAVLSSTVMESLKLTKKLKRLKSSITLYAPPSIQTTHHAEYSLTEDKLAAMANSDMAGAIQQAILHPINSGGKLSRILASTNSTVSSMSKTAYNPKKDLLFKSMGNRSFGFDFQFAPKNSEEAKRVRDIIYMFKLFSHPELLEGYGQFLYLYPAEFDIEYGFINEEGLDTVNTHLNKISSCLLETISVNYGSNGSYQSLANGEPILTTMRLQFKEIETLHQARIREGY
jgi:hypothetical protein